MFTWLFVCLLLCLFTCLFTLELLQPTRDVSYIHTCTSITSHSFRFTWLPPTDNSNPVNYNLTITCTFRPLLQEVYAVIVTAPLAVVVISRTFDRFTECEYLLSPFPDGPSVQGQMDQLSFSKLFVCLFVCLFVYLFVYLFICLFICLFIYLFVYLFICLFVCLFIYLFIYLFVYLFVCLFVYLFICLFVYLFVCLFVYLFICLFVYLFVCLFVCLFVYLFVCLFICLFVPLFVCLLLLFTLDNLVGAQYFVQITNRDFINIQISNITMCLYDLHGNEQIFDTQVFLSDDTTQVAQFDASYANYYDSETETLSLVGYLSSGSNILQSGTNYSVSIQFPVNVNRLYYQWYTHDLGEFIVVSPLCHRDEAMVPLFVPS